MIADWKEAKRTREAAKFAHPETKRWVPQRWKPPEEGCFKLNVDASLRNGLESFTIGLIIRDNLGVPSVFGAETLVVKEGLAWLMSLPSNCSD